MKRIFLFLLIIPLFLQCTDKKDVPTSARQRGEPVVNWERPVEDSITHTFSLALSTDSVDGANVSYQLMDNGEVLMTMDGTSVEFAGIEPLDDGYDVLMRAEWPNDTIITRTVHVTGFVLAPPPFEPLTANALQQLINAKDVSIKRGTDERISQAVTLTITDATEKPAMLREVIKFIDNGLWQSVIVTNVELDPETRQVVSISLKPLGEKVEEVEEEDVELDYDEDF